MQIPTEAPSSIMLSDEQLMVCLDRAGLWSNHDGVRNSLRGALRLAAERIAEGRNPFPLHGPEGEWVAREQILRLCRRLSLDRPR
jgi:hypothetical protein